MSALRTLAGGLPVVGVVGGSGGLGTSSMAAALAADAASSTGCGVLIDLDPAAGGIDVLLGIEAVPGARWSDLHLRGGRIEPVAVDDALPRWGEVAVLAADAAPAARAVVPVVEAAVVLGPVALDLGRIDHPGAAVGVGRCDLVLVLASGDVAGLAAARCAMKRLGTARVALVLRRGDIGARDAAQAVGVAVIAQLPALRRRAGRLDPTSQPAPLARVAAGVLDGYLG